MGRSAAVLGAFYVVCFLLLVACVASAKGMEGEASEGRSPEKQVGERSKSVSEASSEGNGEEGREGALAAKTHVFSFIRSQSDRKILIGREMSHEYKSENQDGERLRIRCKSFKVAF